MNLQFMIDIRRSLRYTLIIFIYSNIAGRNSAGNINTYYLRSKSRFPKNGCCHIYSTTNSLIASKIFASSSSLLEK